LEPLRALWINLNLFEKDGCGSLPITLANSLIAALQKGFNLWIFVDKLTTSFKGEGVSYQRRKLIDGCGRFGARRIAVTSPVNFRFLLFLLFGLESMQVVPHDEAQRKYIPKEVHRVIDRCQVFNCMELIEEKDNGSGDVGESEDNKDCLDPSSLVF